MLKDIISISGQSGLFKLISRGNNVIIVETIADGKRMPAKGSSLVSDLENISIYVEDGDIKLSKVFAKIFRYTKGSASVDGKKASADELKKTMDNVLPNWDKDRVHVSHLKKLFSWYNLLLSKNIINEESVKAAEEEKEEEEK